MRWRNGLVIGKFCPLHRGHELVIERALSECDHVIVLSYTRPEFPRCEPAARERWLQQAFPQVTTVVLDDVRLARWCRARGLPPRTLPHNDGADEAHREFCAWICIELLDTHVDALFTSEDYGEGCARTLSRIFSAHLGRAHSIAHVSVDQARLSVPISGTRIRVAPFRFREYLSPHVAADFVRSICILGGESTGKTTLATALAAHLQTVLVPEYGRELWQEQGGRLTYEDMLRIAQVQIARETALAPSANEWLVCDDGPLTSYVYSLLLYERAEPQLDELASRHYDHILLCAPDFDFAQDGTRRDATFRQRQHALHLDELQRRGLRWNLLTGSTAARLDHAVELLSTIHV